MSEMHSTTPPSEAPLASHPIGEPRGGAKRTKKNTRAKGDRIERLAIKLLRGAGYRVEPRPTRPRYLPNQKRVLYVPVDWFGRFDWLAVRRGYYRWGQAVEDVGGHAAEARRELFAEASDFLVREFSVHRVTIELWRHQPGAPKAKAWIVERYDLKTMKWQRVDPETGMLYHEDR